MKHKMGLNTQFRRFSHNHYIVVCIMCLSAATLTSNSETRNNHS